jgi:hypothetical protein
LDGKAHVDKQTLEKFNLEIFMDFDVFGMEGVKVSQNMWSSSFYMDSLGK